ncbi:hypothetical protein V1264_004117 [Littorina saxatilis]
MFKSLSSQSLTSRANDARRPSVSGGPTRRSIPNARLPEVEQTDDGPGQLLDYRERKISFLLSKKGSPLPAIAASDMVDRDRRESFSRFGDDVELDTQIIRINVGGTMFHTTRDTLRRFPETFLGNLSASSPYFNRRKREYFFDRNPSIFASVLDLFRTNELHLPRNHCGNTALKELEFWEIPAIWVSACCWSNIHDAIQDKRLFQDLKSSPAETFDSHLGLLSWREWIWKHLYAESTRKSRLYRIWNNMIAMVIIATLAIFFIDSTTEIHPHDYFDKYIARHNGSSRGDGPAPHRRQSIVWLADVVILGVMNLEFMLKMAVCPNLKHLFSSVFTVLYGLSLLACIAGHIAESTMESLDNWTHRNTLDTVYVFLRCVHFLRMIRFFELLDRNASLKVMWIATKRCQTELLLLLGVFLVLAILFGSLAYFCELYGRTDGTKFTSGLTVSLYWAVITMSTVGYGDITPKSDWGRMVGALCSICGVIVLAMPVAILTESFQQYNLRQKIRHEKRKRQEDYFRKNSLGLHSLGNFDGFSI